MIFIGIGANLSNKLHQTPLDACVAALEMLANSKKLTVVKQSLWYKSAPVPASEQPWYVNGVAQVDTALGPMELLAFLHRLEEQFGRVRSYRNAPRIIDLDLLDYSGQMLAKDGLDIPHPRLHERAFVLLPLQDVAPDWRDPRSGELISVLIPRLSKDQICVPIADV